MIGQFAHIGTTASNIEESIKFYIDILILDFEGQMIMEGEATDKLFNIKTVKLKEVNSIYWVSYI